MLKLAHILLTGASSDGSCVLFYHSSATFLVLTFWYKITLPIYLVLFSSPGVNLVLCSGEWYIEAKI